MFKFIGDTVHILFLIAMAIIAVAINLVIIALELGAYNITQVARMLTLLLGAYAAKINAVLTGVPLAAAPKGTTIN